MVSLEQWDKRIDKELGKENDTIGFYIMKVKKSSKQCYQFLYMYFFFGKNKVMNLDSILLKQIIHRFILEINLIGR